MTIEITDMSFTGDGIGRVTLKNGETITIYAPGSAPGDCISFPALPGKKPYTIHSYNIDTPSPFRTQPPCPHAFYCGGCTYQHIDYEAQLDIKTRQLRNLFPGEFLGNNRIHHAKPFRYRNRVTLQFRNGKTGFSLKDNSDIYPFAGCLLLEKEIEQEASAIAAIPPMPGYYGVTVYRDGTEILRHYLRKREDNAAFSQVNDDVNSMLINHLRSIFLPLGDDIRLLDLYCGNGNLSLPFGAYVKKAVGVDISYTSIQHARAFAKENHFDHYHYYDTAIDTAEKTIREMARDVNVLILDPPRRGTGTQTPFLAALGIPLVVYISCNPLTFKKDIRHFLHSGYTTANMGAFDMFPNTPHFEICGVFTKQNNLSCQ